MTRSSAASIARGRARELARRLRRSPSQASSIAAEPISEAGLATFLPAMSGAEPCCACATRVLGAGIERGGEPEAAGDLARLVGEDVADTCWW